MEVREREGNDLPRRRGGAEQTENRNGAFFFFYCANALKILRAVVIFKENIPQLLAPRLRVFAAKYFLPFSRYEIKHCTQFLLFLYSRVVAIAIRAR